MKISGHKTDSMERRYNIADLEDLAHARELMGKRSGTVVVEGKTAEPGDRVDVEKKAS